MTWDDEISEQDRQLNQQRCDCIEANEFWFSKPKQLNDPYDCTPYFERITCVNQLKTVLDCIDHIDFKLLLKNYPKSQTREDILQLFELLFKGKNKNIKAFSECSVYTILSQIVMLKVSNTGILSFTTEAYNNLMWSHYAKNHTGICLEIDIPENTTSLKSVTYTKEQPRISIHEATAEQYGKFDDIFYKKASHWSYEQEWRMVALEGNKRYKIPNTKITKILFGVNISKSTKSKIRDIVKGQIPTFQLYMTNKYTLKTV